MTTAECDPRAGVARVIPRAPSADERPGRRTGIAPMFVGDRPYPCLCRPPACLRVARWRRWRRGGTGGSEGDPVRGARSAERRAVGSGIWPVYTDRSAAGRAELRDRCEGEHGRADRLRSDDGRCQLDPADSGNVRGRTGWHVEDGLIVAGGEEDENLAQYRFRLLR